MIESLQKEIESLLDEISQLKNTVMQKEEQLKDQIKDVSKMEKKTSVQENENKNLKKQHAVESKILVKSDTNNQNKSNTKLNLSSKKPKNF